jgi:hypothetical protein
MTRCQRWQEWTPLFDEQGKKCVQEEEGNGRKGSMVSLSCLAVALKV